LIGGLCYHVINRGNGRTRVFHNEADYREFLNLLTSASDRLPMRLIAYCLMPNHVHLVLWPHGDGELSRWMQWLLTAQVRRHHRRHGTSGHLWQGRFKAFPIQKDEHLLAVLRYVERNPLRAGLVGRAEDWPWSSLGAPEFPVAADQGAAPALALHPGPLPRGANWRHWVNEAEDPDQLAALRASVNRGAPWGSPSWVRRTAGRLGLEASLRPRGRPRKADRP
jgi:putative transposase